MKMNPYLLLKAKINLKIFKHSKVWPEGMNLLEENVDMHLSNIN